MLTPAEKRFIRYWEDQRKDGRWSYYLLYTLVGTFIVGILIAIVIIWFFQEKIRPPYWRIPVAGFVTSTAITLFSWSNNERRFRKIIRREIREN